jgi:hypothetical protein
MQQRGAEVVAVGKRGGGSWWWCGEEAGGGGAAGKGPAGCHPVRLAYQPPANSTFLSQQTSHQQPANRTFLSEQTSTSHQPPAKRTICVSTCRSGWVAEGWVGIKCGGGLRGASGKVGKWGRGGGTG